MKQRQLGVSKRQCDAVIGRGPNSGIYYIILRCVLLILQRMHHSSTTAIDVVVVRLEVLEIVSHVIRRSDRCCNKRLPFINSFITFKQ